MGRVKERGVTEEKILGGPGGRLLWVREKTSLTHLLVPTPGKVFSVVSDRGGWDDFELEEVTRVVGSGSRTTEENYKIVSL